MSIAVVQVSREALRHNVASLKTEGVRTVAAVKANGYGAGLEQVVECIEDLVDFFQVDDYDELVRLRASTEKQAHVFGYVEADALQEALGLDAELAVFDADHAAQIGAEARKLRRPVKVHLKIDALLGRLGTLPSEVPTLLKALEEFPELQPVAAYAHFANIEDTTDLSHAEEQIRQFEIALTKLRQVYPTLGRHMSATSGVMTDRHGSSPDDLARLGIGVYGLYPSAALAKTRSALKIKPAIEWKTVLAQVKTLPPRHPVGYGLTYITSREMRIGIVPQGYSDGYDRGLSNVGEVLVGGKRCPVLGRIAMNMFAVDLSAVPGAKREDEVVLLGRQGSEAITAEELAARLGTINYEIIARLNPAIRRQIV